VEGARVGARTIGIDRLIEVNTQVRNLVPVGQRGARLPDRLELLDGQAVHRVVRVNHDGERVVGDGELFVGDAVGGARGRLLITDRPGCIGDVGLAVAELLEAAAGARLGHVDGDVRILGLEELGRSLRERAHGAGTVETDHAAERCGVYFRSFVIATAAAGDDG